MALLLVHIHLYIAVVTPSVRKPQGRWIPLVHAHVHGGRMDTMSQVVSKDQKLKPSIREQPLMELAKWRKSNDTHSGQSNV